ncbi:MAG: response regulator [Pseudanabaenaceae cyanobacterium bins.68]|nr:response regulator [Pseudanabaenaceae cyanobacterium bins.68]
MSDLEMRSTDNGAVNAQADTPTSTPSSEKILVLVVDDEPEVERLFRQRFRRQLRNAEFDFVFANNGLDALRILRESSNQICLVLTDINMPEMDGLTLLSKLPEIDQNLKAVVVSAYGDIKNIRIAMNRGAFDFVTKPIDFEDLEITINKTLNFVKFVRSQQEQLEQAQSSLIQSEKMASLGQLMAGVAHEIKNPINFIHNNICPAREYVDLLNTQLEQIQSYISADQDPFDQPAPLEVNWPELEFMLTDLQKILTGMEVGTEMLLGISATLRNFARSDDTTPTSCNLHTCIDTVLLILSHRLKARGRFKQINVVKNYGDIPLINCYAGQINQVFMNILANSIDALEEAMTADPILVPEIKVTTTLAQPDYVRVIIADNGTGMPQDIQQMIFEPLFTTKPSGKGTGLGMSISREIVVERHRGKISCTSELGKGTEFMIDLLLNLTPEV